MANIPQKTNITETFPPLNSSERDILISLVKKHDKVIENKKTNKVFNSAKEQAWKKLAHEFNSYPDVYKRTDKNLRKTWENMKSRTKREYAADKKSTYKTGGGKNSSVQVSAESVKIHEIVGPQIDPLENAFDDDGDGISHFKRKPMRKTLDVESDEKENSAECSVSALKNATCLSDSSDDEVCSLKTMPKGKRRKMNQEEQLLSMERKEHMLRCQSTTLSITQSKEIHEKRIKVLELEEQYWRKKVNDTCDRHESIIL